MKEVRLDHTGMKGRVLLLEDDANDVVADVPFTLDLRRVRACERQQRAHVKHDLLLIVEFVVRDWTVGLFAHVEASSVATSESCRREESGHGSVLTL